MKRKFLALSVLLAMGVAGNAQTGGLYKNTLKVGASGGIAVPNKNAAASASVDIAYQHLVTNHFGLGVATGYTHFFGKDKDLGNTTLQNNSFGVVPVAALVRYYPAAKGFYVGTDLGYGVITGDEKVAENAAVNRPDGGFYLKPQIGYHNRNWNVFAHYSKVFTGNDGRITVGNETQKYNAGTIGVGFAYNIGLGQ